MLREMLRNRPAEELPVVNGFQACGEIQAAIPEYVVFTL